MMRRAAEFDLPLELMREHSKRNTLRVARWIGADTQRFEVLMGLVLGGDTMTARRASWVMSLCIEKTPSLAGPWVRELVSVLDGEHHHSAVIRNAARSLQFIPIPPRSQGRVVDLCIGILRSVRSEIAVKAFAMTVLQNIVKNEPELRHEVILVIEPLMEYGSAGVRSRARKVLKALKTHRI